MDSKDKDLRIRCSKEVRRMFRVFITRYDFANSEDALKWLLEHTTPPPILKEGKVPIKSFMGSAALLR